MKHLFSLLIVALATQGILAQQIGLEEARSRAYEAGQQQAARRAPVRGQQPEDLGVPELAYICSSRTAEQKVCFYVFNYPDDQGYVVIGGDAVAKEVLGYSESGSFDWDTAPDNLKWWLSQYQDEIDAVMNLTDEECQLKARPRAATTADDERVDIPFMLTTEWNQSFPYNKKVNEELTKSTGVKHSNQATGCVATAAAQIMNYHKYPEHGQGEAYCTNQGYQLYADFSKSTYCWSLMENKYSISWTTSDEDAVALLMYDIGVSCNMVYYDNGSSGASSRLMGFAFVDNFKYDKSMLYRWRSCYTDEEWENLLYNELEENGPVYYAGGDHAFVCDGYRASDNAFHFNWGWGASGNYFQISGTDTGFLFPTNQQILSGIKPDIGGDAIPLMCQATATADNKDFAMKLSRNGEKIMSYDYDQSAGSQTMYFSWDYYICTLAYDEFDVAIEATERSTGYKAYLRGNNSPTKVKKSNNSATQKYGIIVDLNQLYLNGTYDLRPASRLASKTNIGDWVPMQLLPSQETPTITVTGAHAPNDVQDLTFELSSSYVYVSEPAYIFTPNFYQGKITYTSSDPDVATISADGKIIAKGEGYTTITAVGEDYINGVKIYNGASETFDIWVEREYLLYYLPGSLYYTSSLKLDWHPLYDGTLSFLSDDTSIATIDQDGTIHGVSGGTTIIRIYGDETPLFYEVSDYIELTVEQNKAELYDEPIIANDGNICPGDSIYFPIIDHGSTDKTVSVFFKRPNDDYGPSWNFEMEPEIRTTIPLAIKGYYSYDQTYTMGLYKDEQYTDPYNIPSVTFTYRRKMEYAYTVPASGYGTLMLPFCADVPSGWEAFGCPELGAEGNTAVLERVSKLVRNRPYIIKATPGATYTFVGPKAIDASAPSFAVGELRGAVLASKLALTTDDYLLDTRDGVTAFYRYQASSSEASYCDEFRAVIHHEAASADVIYLTLPGPWGDVNGDDRVSVGDVSTLINYLRGTPTTSFVKGNADANKNGTVDNADVDAIRDLVIEKNKE